MTDVPVRIRSARCRGRIARGHLKRDAHEGEFWLSWTHGAIEEDVGYQISESLIAIGTGGVTGRGLGNGTGKLGYVPELWNDFIGTIVAEELGLIGVALLIALFAGILWRGVRISFNCDDSFGQLLAFGITMLLGLQGAVNLCVVTGLLPTKGLTLPFVSFGGSSMIMALFAIGILLNISRERALMFGKRSARSVNERQDNRWEKKRKRLLKSRQ
ncbi:MAG: FtsW/RodA/SpoVE family cell cycle protein [bacterium]